MREQGLGKGPWPGLGSCWTRRAWGGQLGSVSSSHLLCTPHAPLNLSGFQRRKLRQAQALAPSHLCLHPCVNERVWGGFHHQAKSYLARCSQRVRSWLRLGTRGVPDPAEACARGQQYTAEYFRPFWPCRPMTFPPLSASESRKGFPFLRPSSVWKPAVPADHREGEGCRGMQQAPPAHSAHLHPWCCVAAGSSQALLPAAIPGLAGLAGTGGSSRPLTECF